MDHRPQSIAEFSDRDAVNRALAKRDFDDLKEEVVSLRASVEDLVKAWNTAASLVSFIKWAGAVATAGAALWVVFKGKLSI